MLLMENCFSSSDSQDGEVPKSWYTIISAASQVLWKSSSSKLRRKLWKVQGFRRVHATSSSSSSLWGLAFCPWRPVEEPQVGQSWNDICTGSREYLLIAAEGGVFLDMYWCPEEGWSCRLLELCCAHTHEPWGPGCTWPGPSLLHPLYQVNWTKWTGVPSKEKPCSEVFRRHSPSWSLQKLFAGETWSLTEEGRGCIFRGLSFRPYRVCWSGTWQGCLRWVCTRKFLEIGKAVGVLDDIILRTLGSNQESENWALAWVKLVALDSYIFHSGGVWGALLHQQTVGEVS